MTQGLKQQGVESPEQVALLNAQIRDAVDHEVIIGIDQEGGLVDRFREICEPMPSAKAVRDAGSSELARKFGALSARALRLMGFNINFAPVLDLSGDNLENGLRGRTFGQSPAEVSRLAGEHLHSVMVSHGAFPEVSEFLQAWFRRTGELPALDSFHQLPATISGNVVMRLLRTVLKFDGLVITDDMEMGAVVQTLTVAEAALRAVEAGSDMILICEQEANFVAARDRVAEAVEKGELPVEALDGASRRMEQALKLAGEYESFDQTEFETTSRDITELK